MAVTGHRGGNVHLWRLSKEAILSESGSSLHRSLIVAYSLTKCHRNDISVIKLLSVLPSSGMSSSSMSAAVAGSHSHKGYIVPPSFECASSLELCVGDVEGFISRWTTHRIDQLPLSDIKQILRAVKNQSDES